MRTKVIIILGIVLFLAIATFLLRKVIAPPQEGTPDSQYRIVGSIKGLTADKVYLTYPHTKDSARVEGGRFAFTGCIPVPTRCCVYTQDGSLRVEFWLENAPVKLTGIAGHECAVVGSKNQDAYTLYKNTMAEFAKRYAKLSADLSEAQDRKVQATVDRITRLLRSVQVEELVFKKDFIAEHPRYYVSLEPLSDLISHERLDYAQGSKFFSGLSIEVRNTIQGRTIDSALNVMKRTAVGQPFTDFLQPDADGRLVKLSDYRGKYVLVTFWFSNSTFCRSEYRNLIKTYNKYREKGFEILAVSFNKQREDWLKAIEEDKLPGKHVSDLKGWGKNEVALLYGIKSLPRNLLINPQGIIVAANLFGQDLEQKLSEVLK